MNPLISFAVPLYNKGEKIAGVIASIHHLCRSLDNRYEICISDNGSSDLNEGIVEHLASRNLIGNCRISRLQVTISVEDNWLYALGMCSAPIVKLQLADDTLCDFDLQFVLSKFEDTRLSFVVGKSRPVVESIDNQEICRLKSYYENVNLDRRNIFSSCDPKSFLRSVTPKALFSGANQFGDINALIMRRECVDHLREPIFHSAFPALLCWPDWEFYTKLALAFSGDFVDEFISDFVYLAASPHQRAAVDPTYKRRVYSDIEATIRMSPLINPDLRRLLAAQLSKPERDRLLLIAMRQLLINADSSWPALFNSLVNQRIGTAVHRVKQVLKETLLRQKPKD